MWSVKIIYAQGNGKLPINPLKPWESEGNGKQVGTRIVELN